MRILDTNVLLRHLLSDDPVQSPKATRFIETGLRNEDGLMVPDLVFAEAVWIMRGKQIDRADIASRFSSLISDDRFLLENRERMSEALATFSKGGDFGDAYLAATAKELGAEAMVSFDHGFSKFNVPWINPSDF